MTRACSLAFLWHFHQPDYRDASGRPLLPWVRLHGLRGYRDLPRLLTELGLAGTINLVPSLWAQLEHYLAGGDDPHLALSMRPAATLTAVERALLRRGFLAGGMIGAHPASAALQARLEDPAPLSDQEVLDVQVWATLAWVGPTGLQERPELVELREKARGFTEEDKAALFSAQGALLAGIPGLWRDFAGTFEVSASPLYHPILPLLVDLEHARRSLPGLPPLPAFRHPDDALLQLRRGKRAIEERLGREVVGLWPSEGSVSPEVAELAAEAGFSWLASDAEVWRRSERGEGSLDRPWRIGEELVALFRDHGLSDLIGFRSAQHPRQAAEELVGGLSGRGPTVLIALDGENPWEVHPDGGEGFLRALATALDRSGHRAVTCAVAAEAPAGEIRRLHTGSWIGGDLRIWAGDTQDQAAWHLLAAAREAVAAAGDPPEALEPLYAAEGSDWFWWYGPEFETEQAGAFDALFRGHLAAAWRALGQQAPAALSRPVAGSEGPRARPPAIVVDEPPLPWTTAGYLPARDPGGAMAAGPLLRGLSWLPGRDRVWLRLDLHGEPAGEVLLEAGAGAWSFALSEGPLELPLPPPLELRITLRAGSVTRRYPAEGAFLLDGPAGSRGA